jgi:hypothetical protein
VWKPCLICGTGSPWVFWRLWSVLRLGTYELLYTDLPIGVPINECVELAKLHGAAGSGSFVNEVLSAVAERRDIGSSEPTSNDVPSTE